MSVLIEVKKAEKLSGPESLFIGFEYKLETVAKIKKLEKRWYNGATRKWEVPTEELPNVLEIFKDDNIKIISSSVKTKSGGSKRTKKVEQVVLSVDDSRAEGFNYKTNPFPHQEMAFQYALRNNSFLLGDEQGLGKTKQAIDIAVNRKYLHGFKHTLIICGVNSLKHNWLKEVSIHSNERAHILGSKVNSKGKLSDGSLADRLSDLKGDIGAHFLITNIETLRNKEVTTELKKLIAKGTIGMAIIDEIHKCKNHTSSQGKAIHNIQPKYRLALTGTPLMNSPLDLFNIMKWLGFEKNSFYAYRNYYCTMGGFGGYEVVGYKNMSELRSRFEKVMLRRKKDEVLDLPPKIRQTEIVELTSKQKILYKEVLNGIKANINEIKLSNNPLAQLIRLRQVTAHTSILTDKFAESAKLDRLKDIIEELASSGQKAIIFSNWERVTEVVRAELSKYNPAYITGSTTDRMEQVERFQNDSNCQVIIGTIGAMGTGLTLTAATTVIFMDSPWNMANKEQAEDRAHRIGTKSTVNIITLVTKDTIDERIEEIVREKAEMAKGLVEGDEDTLARLENPAQYLDRLLS